jgi:hypothetical protein
VNIQTIPIVDIKRAKYNPRKALKHGDPAYEKLKKAVLEFGLVEPLVWNSRTKNLVGGHQRLSIIEERGDSQVEVSVVDLDEHAEKVLNLALNKQGGEWDFATLADLLQELDAGDIDMEITGFGIEELAKLMTWTPNEIEWGGMPEFDQPDATAWKSVIVHFRNKEDYEDFSKLVNQTLTDKTRSIWYPFKAADRTPYQT